MQESSADFDAAVERAAIAAASIIKENISLKAQIAELNRLCCTNFAALANHLKLAHQADIGLPQMAELCFRHYNFKIVIKKQNCGALQFEPLDEFIERLESAKKTSEDILSLLLFTPLNDLQNVLMFNGAI